MEVIRLKKEFSTIRIYKSDFDRLVKAVLKLQAVEGKRVSMCEFFHLVVEGKINVPKLLEG